MFAGAAVQHVPPSSLQSMSLILSSLQSLFSIMQVCVLHAAVRCAACLLVFARLERLWCITPFGSVCVCSMKHAWPA